MASSGGYKRCKGFEEEFIGLVPPEELAELEEEKKKVREWLNVMYAADLEFLGLFGGVELWKEDGDQMVRRVRKFMEVCREMIGVYEVMERKVERLMDKYEGLCHDWRNIGEKLEGFMSQMDRRMEGMSHEMEQRLEDFCRETKEEVKMEVERGRREQDRRIEGLFRKVEEEIGVVSREVKEVPSRIVEKVVEVNSKVEIDLADKGRKEDVQLIEDMMEEVADERLCSGVEIMKVEDEERWMKVAKRRKRGSMVASESMEDDGGGEPKMLDPMVIVCEVNAELGLKKVEEFVWKENRQVFEEMGEEERSRAWRITHRGGSSDPKCVSWIARVEPKVFKSLIMEDSIYVGGKACRVKEYAGIVRCYKCQGLGHMHRVCRGEITCSRCGEEGHHVTQCEGPVGEHRCANCMRRNCKEINHPVMWRGCPSRWLERQRRKGRTRYE